MHKINLKEWSIILGLAVLKLIIHLLTNTNYELHRDAFLYYSLGEHLDWGYLSVPPFIAIISKLSVLIFGNTVFALRFFPALIGSASVIIIALIVKELKGNIFAIIIATLAFILSPAFLRSNTLFQPVSFNQFFWLLSIYFVIRLIQSNNQKIWLQIFIIWGIAFYNKYSIAFLIVGTIFSFLITKHRHLLWSKYFFTGGIVSILLILPNIIWQYMHNWPLIHHMGELYKYQFVNVTLFGFIIDQIVMNLPCLIIWVTALVVFLINKAEKQFRIIPFIYLSTVILLILLSGKSYYTLGLYPVLFGMGGYAISKYYNTFFKVITIIVMVFISWSMLPFSLPIYSFEKVEEISVKTAPFTNRWEDGQIHSIPQDYADMSCWNELANIVINTYNSLPNESKGNCSIYAEQYCTAGAISFYGKKYGLPEVISFNDNFLVWAPDSFKNEILIYVNDEIGDIERLFKDYQLEGQINNKYFREDGMQVYLCSNPVDSFPIFYAEKVKALKSNYNLIK